MYSLASPSIRATSRQHNLIDVYQLEVDEQHGVIERLDGPTPWVSPIVEAPKPKQPTKI